MTNFPLGGKEGIGKTMRKNLQGELRSAKYNKVMAAQSKDQVEYFKTMYKPSTILDAIRN